MNSPQSEHVTFRGASRLISPLHSQPTIQSNYFGQAVPVPVPKQPKPHDEVKDTTNIDMFKIACIKDKSVLYDDEVFSIECYCELEESENEAG